MDIPDIVELHEKALQKVQSYAKKRFVYEDVISEQGKHFVGIIGPRGVGKTIILKQLANDLEDTCYLSLDTLFENLDLFDVVQTLNETYKKN